MKSKTTFTINNRVSCFLQWCDIVMISFPVHCVYGRTAFTCIRSTYMGYRFRAWKICFVSSEPTRRKEEVGGKTCCLIKSIEYNEMNVKFAPNIINMMSLYSILTRKLLHFLITCFHWKNCSTTSDEQQTAIAIGFCEVESFD